MSEGVVVGIAYAITYGLLVWYVGRLLLRLRRRN
ncbi:hypothetical protein BH18ACT6_BH18ACT6_01070 [soil metagenome]